MRWKSGKTNRRTNNGDGYSDCWLCGLFGGGGMSNNDSCDQTDLEFLTLEEYVILKKKASAWDRVVSIANDGVGLKASEIKTIEKQEIK